jgi:hypothetical protein
MLLIQASLPERYWAEGLHTTVYLLNRRPTKTINAVCPHVALFDSAPSYEHLHVFGCACYPNIATTALHKPTPRSTRCVFLGYSTNHKGYRCLDLSTNRLIVSRHVVFYEDSFPLAASPNLTDLDFLCETGSSVSTIGNPLSLTGSSITPACQPTPIVPSGFEPHVAPMPVPLPAPQVPPSFPPRAALDHRSWQSDRLPGRSDRPLYRGWRSDYPLYRGWRSNRPSGGLTTWGPSTSLAASPDVGPPPRAWPTSPIAYTCRPRQPVTPSPATPPRRLTTAVPVTPPVNPHPMVTRAKDSFWLPRDRLTLITTTSSSPPSTILTSVRAVLADPNCARLWRSMGP